MQPRDISLRSVVAEALRPGRSAAEYAVALRELDGRWALDSSEWRDLLAGGVATDPRARRALYEHLVSTGEDVVPLLVFDVDDSAHDLCVRVLRQRAERLRDVLQRRPVQGEPTGLPCRRCGACALDRLAEHDHGRWTETELRCARCHALHLGYADDHGPLVDLMLLEDAVA